MWPVAAASTITTSQSARPSSDSRTSQQTLPTVRISLTPGAAVATKSRTLASGTDPAEHRDAQVAPQVLAQGASVSICMAQHPGVDLDAGETDRGVLEQRGQVALGVDLDEQDAPAVLGQEERRRGGDRALADPALAGEEQQSALEEARAERRRHRVSWGRTRPLGGPVGLDLHVGDPLGGHADPAARHVGQPQHAALAAEHVVDRRLDLGRRSPPPRGRAPWGV